MPHTAAIVLDAKYDVLAWNPLAAALLEDFSAQPRRERNLIRRYFLHPDPSRRHYGITGGGDFGRFAAGHLRAAAARYPATAPPRNSSASCCAAAPSSPRCGREQLRVMAEKFRDGGQA
jgi:hypothetical protein